MAFSTTSRSYNLTKHIPASKVCKTVEEMAAWHRTFGAADPTRYAVGVMEKAKALDAAVGAPASAPLAVAAKMTAAAHTPLTLHALGPSESIKADSATLVSR